MKPIAAPREPAPSAVRVPEVPRKTEKASAPTSNKRVLKTMGQWAEICARVAKQSPPTAGWLAQTRAYTEGGDKIVVRLPNEFFKIQLSSENAKSILFSAIGAELGRNVCECDVTFEVKAAKDCGPDETIFDEIDAANET